VAVSDDVAAGGLRTVGRPPQGRRERRVPQVPAESRFHLRTLLVTVDAIALGLAWGITLVPWPYSGRPEMVSFGVAAILSVVGIWIIYLNGLYLARNATMRTMEMARIGRSVVLLGLVAFAGSRVANIRLGSGRLNGEILVGSLASLGFLLVARSTYRAWLSTARRNGKYVRDVIVIGTNREAYELVTLFHDHTELGFRVAGVLGDRDEAIANDLGNLWCGIPIDAPCVLADRKATGVVVAMGTLDADSLTDMVRVLHAAGAHVHISSGLRRIDHRRLRALPLAYEPLFYVEPWALPGRHLVAKRALDIACSGLILLFAAPVLLLIALVIKLQDRGPVLFKQTRVGTNGELFKLYKFRTMVVDAEARLAGLTAQNDRMGPLFKMAKDPRVTRAGRFLRASSLDELPQLLNVLKSDMSLVGPRPALPTEAEKFDEELRDRTRVKPGITGLWQVEARDNPSFAAYRRLDLYYVENWSVSLDIVILLATIEHVVTRFATAVFGRR
jgi:exopolysaccharide biosynthesis polyprenyl glycosylphosphotransferase